MKVEELRIGNWVRLNVRPIENYQVTQILEKGVNCGDVGFLYDMAEPIPLTEEWLESTNINGTSFGAELCFTIWTEGNKIYLEQYGEGRVLLDHIKYRHQVQNFYHALTGEELQTDEIEQKVNL